MGIQSRREFLKVAGLGVAGLGVAALGVAALAAAKLAEPAAAAAKQPNVILFFTDDQGWTDTSVQMLADRPDSRSDFYRTPALERLAREGMIFSNAYSCAPTCTPSRAGIQFGKTPARLRQTVVHDVLAKSRGIDCKNEMSLAQMVKAANPRYVTAHFGKWGFPPRTPEHAGYDVTDGDTNNGHGDYLDVKLRTPLTPDDPKRIFSVTRRANAFMERQVAAGRPFFMQVSHYAGHVQHHALTETVEQCRKLPRGKKCKDADYADPPPARNAWTLLYAAMLENLDAGLGLLLDRLDALGIADRTYVIFTSDNGGGFRNNAPLKGGKASVWEGGLRVPTVVRGPGVLAGRHCDAPVAGWDIFPTVSDLIGNRKPPAEGLDGGSLRPLLERGNAGRVTRGTEALIFHFPWYAGAAASAIRLGDYKLIENLNTGETRLFNLAADLGESNDLSRALPAKANELHGILKNYLKQVDAETIGDMRAARRKEILGYAVRTQKQIDDLRERLSIITGAAEKQNLEKELAAKLRQMEIHRTALAGLEQAEKRKAW